MLDYLIIIKNGYLFNYGLFFYYLLYMLCFYVKNAKTFEENEKEIDLIIKKSTFSQRHPSLIAICFPYSLGLLFFLKFITHLKYSFDLKKMIKDGLL